KQIRLDWHVALGAGREKYKFENHVKPAHYANAAVDIEFEYPFGFREVEGIHSRTDFDLKQHMEFSGKKLQYFDTANNKRYIPYVVETSVGLDRLFLSVLSNALTYEEVQNGDKTDTRVVLKIHPVIAPVKAAVLPLTR